MQQQKNNFIIYATKNELFLDLIKLLKESYYNEKHK